MVGKRNLFLKKIAKKALFLAYFSKDLTNHAFGFCPFRRKTQFIGNFEKSFENFQKISKENCKNIMLAYFSKKFKKPCADFCAFGRKTQFIRNFEKVFEHIS